MQNYAFALNLKQDDELVDRYLEYHRAVWPEVLRSLNAVGINQMRLFRIGYRLFMYIETVDGFNPSIDFPRYLTLDEHCKVWEDLMDSFQSVCEEAAPGEKWALMDQIFDFETQLNQLNKSS
ncbi:L-rhamnose mutarotase [Spongorhabdus nitratireducens]